MCLMVYLGTDRPVEGFSDVAEGAIGLAPDVTVRPGVLADKAHVMRICDRVPTGWNCSCVFLDQAMPWEDPDAADDVDAPVRRVAYQGLRQIAKAALAVDPDAVLFSCWSGDENKPVLIEREMVTEALLADRYVFDDVTDEGSGGNPPVLIRLRMGK